MLSCKPKLARQQVTPGTSRANEQGNLTGSLEGEFPLGVLVACIPLFHVSLLNYQQGKGRKGNFFVLTETVRKGSVTMAGRCCKSLSLPKSLCY